MAEGRELKKPLTLSIALTNGAKDKSRGDHLKSLKKLRSSNITVDDLFFKIDDEEDEFQDTSKGKKSKKKLLKKVVLYSMNIVGRWLSLTDLVTDGILFYRATVYGKDNHSALPLTIGLFTSMIAPYILSYSSGVKLFLFRGTFKELQGFYRVLLLLFLFPTGVLYFVFLDILDIFLNLFKWVVLIIGWSEIQIKQLEEVLALQVGMDRMNWEGFKRQKSVAQLMFETVPQITIQALLYANIIPGRELTGISSQILMTSIFSASLNCVRQILKLVLESRAVQQNVIEYSLHCVMARVGWVPFRTTIDTFRISNQMHSDPMSIDYNIKYPIPIITKCCGITGTMEYDFSSRTVRHLVAVLAMVEGKRKRAYAKQKLRTPNDELEKKEDDEEEEDVVFNSDQDEEEESDDDDDDDDDDLDSERMVSIKFGKTLRLLTLQDL
eukprot:1093486_1